MIRGEESARGRGLRGGPVQGVGGPPGPGPGGRARRGQAPGERAWRRRGGGCATPSSAGRAAELGGAVIATAHNADDDVGDLLPPPPPGGGAPGAHRHPAPAGGPGPAPPHHQQAGDPLLSGGPRPPPCGGQHQRRPLLCQEPPPPPAPAPAAGAGPQAGGAHGGDHGPAPGGQRLSQRPGPLRPAPGGGHGGGALPPRRGPGGPAGPHRPPGGGPAAGAGWGEHQFRSAHLRALVDLARSPRPSGRVDLPHGLTAERTYGALLLFRGEGGPLPPFAPVPLALRGETEVPDVGWTFSCRPAPAPEEPPSGPDLFYLDPGRLSGPLTVRPRQEGDALAPPGRRRRTVKKWLIDGKVPRPLPGADPPPGGRGRAGMGWRAWGRRPPGWPPPALPHWRSTPAGRASDP